MGDATCSIAGCEKKATCRGLCPSDYGRWARAGRPDGPTLASVPTLEERFWEKVDQDGPLSEFWPELGPCWIWTAATDPNGYGRFHMGQVREGVGPGTALAHRLSYVLSLGPIPDDLDLDHLCRVRRCVRWEHLEPVTPGENQDRGIKPRGDYCWNGHAKVGDNVYQPPDGSSTICRTCRRESIRRWRERQKISA